MNRRTILWMIVVTTIVILGLIFYIRSFDDSSPDTVRVVSWGGQFQADLVDYWIAPAAEYADIPIQTEPWGGDYASLTSQLQRGVINWDLIHVEDLFVADQLANDELAHIDRQWAIDALTTSGEIEKHLPYAVPVHSYAYILVYNAKSEGLPADITYQNFFDPAIKARRGLRDFPHGTLEAALLSLGNDLNKTIYRQGLKPAELNLYLDEAFAQLDRIRDQIIWWRSGDQLQNGIESETMQMALSWSGRALSAERNSQKLDAPSVEVAVAPGTSIISIDYWLIPTESQARDSAEQLLKTMFTAPNAKAWVRDVAVRQGYRPLIKDFQTDDDLVNEYLDYSKPGNGVEIDAQFWGKHFGVVMERWRTWRARE